jgi:hypothetical protein
MEPSEYWLQEFSYQREEVLHRLEVQSALGQAALKNMMLVNGASIVSLLTFVGNKGAVVDASALKTSMAMFGGGLFSALAAYFGAYFSQANFMNVAGYRVVNAQSQMAGGDQIPTPPIFEKRGTILLYGAVGFVLLALALFGAGAVFALNGIL